MQRQSSVSLIRPGNFSVPAAADRMRETFDSYNEQIVYFREPVGIDFIGDSIIELWNWPSYFGGSPRRTA
jgi:hypothetical protein